MRLAVIVAVIVPVVMTVRRVVVRMRMRVGMLVRVDVLLMHVSRDRFFANHAELRRTDARTDHGFRPDGFRRNGQAAERTADILERNTRVYQCTEHHVARGAREAVEVQNPHNRTILPGYPSSPRGNCPASMNE